MTLLDFLKRELMGKKILVSRYREKPMPIIEVEEGENYTGMGGCYVFSLILTTVDGHKEVRMSDDIEFFD